MAKDTQNMAFAADKPSMENHGLQTSTHWKRSDPRPSNEQLQNAADVLNAGSNVAVLVGQGALGARSEVTQLAERLGFPVAKALLGRAVLADDSPYTTGGIGHLGTMPSQFIMRECDTLLILASTMPWIDFYPPLGRARFMQVDSKGEHIGLRYPVEVGLIGDVRSTLRALTPMLRQNPNRTFLTAAQIMCASGTDCWLALRRPNALR